MVNETATTEPSGENDDAHIHVRVDPELKRDVRVAAAKQNMSISDYVRQLLREDSQDD